MPPCVTKSWGRVVPWITSCRARIPRWSDRARSAGLAVAVAIEGLHERGPGSLSTKLYWWYLGTLRLFEAELTDGTLRLTPPDELVALMGELIND